MKTLRSMGHYRCSALVSLIAVFAIHSPVDGDVTFSLFDGRGLGGWTAVHGAKFSVKDSVLRLDGGMGWLRTEYRFRDFVLSLDWRALEKKHDSGIFFRAPLEGKPWPRGYQVNLREDEIGKLVGVDGGGGPTPASVKPLGEWNHFELSVRGKAASLMINGVEAWKTEALEERDGFIGFQAEEHPFEFRKIELTELGYTDLTESGGEGREWKHLKVVGAGEWAAKPGGLLVNSGAGGGWIGTKEPDWSDFTVKLEYKVPKDGNSGVFLRHPLEGNPAYEGLEIQIIDDDTKRWRLEEYQHSGALYHAVPPSMRATRAAGTWESLEITASGKRILVHLNGFPVVDADLDLQTEKIGEARALKDRPRKGHIGLQSYGTGIEFRNFRVKRA